MTITELRIGNYYLNDKGEAVKWEKWMYDSTHEFEEIESVQLTEEWLLKFGFEYFGRMTGWVIGNHSINEFGDFFEFCINKEIPVKLQYVHQLQNLYFALTGEELVCK